MRAVARKVAAAVEVLTAEQGRAPTPLEVAARLGVDVSRLSASAGDVADSRVDHLHHDGADVRRPDEVVDAATCDHTTTADWDRTRGLLAQAAAAMPADHRAVVHLHYGRRMGLREVGDVLGMSSGRATRLYAEACLLLREHLSTVV